MPDVIPKSVLIRRAVDKLAKGIRFILRGLLVATIWLVLVPYFTVWVWRMYFWIGEKFAYNINGLEAPLWNTTYPITTPPANITTTNTTLENPKDQPKILLKGNFALSGDHWLR